MIQQRSDTFSVLQVINKNILSVIVQYLDCETTENLWKVLQRRLECGSVFLSLPTLKYINAIYP